MSKNICFYHKADFDGKCSAAIVYQHFSDNYIKEPDVEFIGLNHGDIFPWEKIKNKIVFMVDFHLNSVDLMEKLNEEAELLIWIDHHKTSVNIENKLKEKNITIEGIRNIDYAACELTWKLLNPHIEIPYGVKLLGRYDIWDHRNDDVVLFQYGMRGYKYGLQHEFHGLPWVDLLGGYEVFVDYILEIGKTILFYQENKDKIGTRNCFELVFENLNFIAINNSHAGSMQFNSIWDESKYDAMMVFHLDDKKRWAFHMYTYKDGIDLSEIASRYGGGGHEGAAGFVIDYIPNEIKKQIFK